MKPRRKIVYIDSDTKYIKKANSTFSKNGNEWIICHTGVEGLKNILKKKPDAVIVDYILSDISGEEVYTRFLTDPKYRSIKDIPFIALTNNGNVDKSRLYRLGFSACLGKPFSARKLFEFVEDVIVSHKFKLEEIYFWETIRKSRDFLERLVESSVDSIITTDSRGIINYCNGASEELLGLTFEELIGKRVSHFLKNGDSELLKISNFLKKYKKVQNYRTSIIRKDGKRIPINISISTMKNGNGGFLGALVISKEVEGETFQEYEDNEFDRLATIIETAIAVNHAINNPLVPILGNIQLILQDEEIVDKDTIKRIKIIRSNALRIRNIIKKLAEITHPVTVEYMKGTKMLDIEAST
jgi:PAS domain S-box-containing protein